ncbi:hypothetical protein SADUNF_Sadunf03G0005900 [Salix dunnii]|uniref:TF-B3 domain-containing protein n=1 Tax=Salix dunnii TaxID=1413687 RepID=A0A835KD55_9ROSI|nr:hypothetical protein SADUNF_Sadunf03G0005900 [Salix dunnii]
MDIQRGLVLPRCSLDRLQSFHGTTELSTIFESAAGNRLVDPVTIHCSTRSGDVAFTTGWYALARDAGLKSGDTVTFYEEVNGEARIRSKDDICILLSPTRDLRDLDHFIAFSLAMEIFTKKLTAMDIQRGLVLPRCSLERLQSFHGTIELSTIFESAAGNRLVGPVTIHCSTRSGDVAFTTGWYALARDAGLKSGDAVTFYEEVNGEARYKLKLRNVGSS